MESLSIERVDHLGLIATVIKDLGLIDMIDARLVPDEQEAITPGQAVAGMILTGPPHADHRCPLWPVRSSAWFGGGRTLRPGHAAPFPGRPGAAPHVTAARQASRAPPATDPHCRWWVQHSAYPPRRAGPRTLAVSRADSRSEARAKAVGVGSSAWFGQARTP